MELRDYLKILGRSWGLILTLTILVTAATIIWTKVTPVKYDSSVTMVVNKPNTVPQRTANYFQYDKYYSIQASSLFADTLTAWLSSPSTAKEIYEKAGLEVPDVSLKKLGKIFKPRRLPPVTIGITVTDKDKDRAEKLVKAAAAIMDEKTTQQHEGDDPDHYFTLISGPVATAQNKPDMAVNIILGVLGGLILSLVIVYVREYLKQS